jgi:hypothetical protein
MRVRSTSAGSTGARVGSVVRGEGIEENGEPKTSRKKKLQSEII